MTMITPMTVAETVVRTVNVVSVVSDDGEGFVGSLVGGDKLFDLVVLVGGETLMEAENKDLAFRVILAGTEGVTDIVVKIVDAGIIAGVKVILAFVDARNE
jgi:hypothetical protein